MLVQARKSGNRCWDLGSGCRRHLHAIERSQLRPRRGVPRTCTSSMVWIDISIFEKMPNWTDEFWEFSGLLYENCYQNLDWNFLWRLSVVLVDVEQLKSFCYNRMHWLYRICVRTFDVAVRAVSEGWKRIWQDKNSVERSYLNLRSEWGFRELKVNSRENIQVVWFKFILFQKLNFWRVSIILWWWKFNFLNSY